MLNSFQKPIFYCFILVCIGLVSTPLAQAHVAENDNGISAVLHISPNDNPKVGEPAVLSFEFKDNEKKFRGEICDCTVNVIRQGQTLFSAKLFTDSESTDLNSPTVDYSFPYESVYTIELIGQPKSADGFHSFKLSYNVRVDKALRSSAGHVDPAHEHEQNKSLHTWHYIIFGTGFLVIIVYYIRERRKMNKKSQENKHNN